MEPIITTEEVAQIAKMAVLTAMAPGPGRATGSSKSGPGEWATKDLEADPAYHHMRAIRHLTTAWNIQAGTEPPEPETAKEHLERAITRAAFCLATLKE